MNKLSMDDVKRLAAKAKTLEKSGHPFLDRRWEGKGPDGRNHCYRRPYYRFCMLLARVVKPDLIVELGIDEGDCCGHWAHGAPEAAVVGVDIHKDGEPPSVIAMEVEAQFLNFTYVRKWTWDAVKDLEPETVIDILFIDSWHTEDYFARDWNDWSPYLQKGSIVVVDDLHMHALRKSFEKLPGELHIDHTMNPAIPIGILFYDGTPLELPYEKQDFMP